jgi:hypothetical protein
MQRISANQMRELAADIALELERLKHLEGQIQRVMAAIQNDPARADLF